MDNLEKTKKEIKEILTNSRLTHEQTVYQLAKYAENQLPYPEGTPEDFYTLVEEQIICDLGEGHAPYCPRYILPDYDKLMKEGCEFLRLDPPTNLYEATTTLIAFYRHVPSVTHLPVYIGRIDKLLDPFITDEEEAKMIIKGFLILIDRMMTSSFCHANIGPEATKAGNIILELEAELQNAIPNLTLLYDPDITPDDFAEKCVQTTLVSAKPAFANHKMYKSEFGEDYGLASCYNGLPIGGGAYTLSRLRLNRIAEKATSVEDFFDKVLPHSVDTLCAFMDAKINYVVNEVPFFESNFLVKEGFVSKERFVGLFGMVGLNECVNILMDMQGKSDRYGYTDEANELGIKIMDAIDARVKEHKNEYSPFWNNNFLLHAQVGAENDYGISPGARIAIGDEIPLYDHLRQAGLFHKYFPSGVGDIFPFDSTSAKNPAAILDIIKGSYKVGIRHFSTYCEDSDLIRVTGYLVKKSDVEAFAKGQAIINETVGGSLDAIENKHILDRKVRSL